MDPKTVVCNLIKSVPIPPGFDWCATYGWEPRTQLDKLFLRSPDGLREIVVSVQFRSRESAEGMFEPRIGE